MLINNDDRLYLESKTSHVFCLRGDSINAFVAIARFIGILRHSYTITQKPRV